MFPASFSCGFCCPSVNLVRNLSLGIFFAFSVTVHQLYFTPYRDTGLQHCFMLYSVITYEKKSYKGYFREKSFNIFNHAFSTMVNFNVLY